MQSCKKYTLWIRVQKYLLIALYLQICFLGHCFREDGYHYEYRNFSIHYYNYHICCSTIILAAYLIIQSAPCSFQVIALDYQSNYLFHSSENMISRKTFFCCIPLIIFLYQVDKESFLKKLSFGKVTRIFRVNKLFEMGSLSHAVSLIGLLWQLWSVKSTILQIHGIVLVTVRLYSEDRNRTTQQTLFHAMMEAELDSRIYKFWLNCTVYCLFCITFHQVLEMLSFCTTFDKCCSLNCLEAN